MDAGLAAALASLGAAALTTLANVIVTRMKNKKDIHVTISEQLADEQKELRKEMREEIKQLRQDMNMWRDRFFQMEDRARSLEMEVRKWQEEVRVWQEKARQLEAENHSLRDLVNRFESKLKRMYERESALEDDIT
jgi:chromosome segregation ATPase